MHYFTSFYLVRHGQSLWNEQGLIQGQANPILSDLGKKQAVKLARIFEKLPINLIFTSDLLRARQTASIIKKEKDVPLFTSKKLREQSLGIFEGKPYSFWDNQFRKITDRYISLTDEEKFLFKLSEDMESDKEVVNRFIAYLKKIGSKHKNKNVLIVTHGSVLRYFLISIGFGTYKELLIDAVKNTAYIHVVLEKNEFRLKFASGVVRNDIIPSSYERRRFFPNERPNR